MTAPERPKRILVVDDDPETVTLLTMILESHGYQVATAHGTAQGMAAMASDVPDAVLLDVMMPHLSGLELCRYVRRDPRIAHIPIIIVSALTGEEHVRAGLQAGATKYIGKPSSPAELLAALDELLAP